MKINNYRKPTMEVVQLQQTQMLAQSSAQSSVGASRSGYGRANTETWGDESAAKANRNTDVWDDDWSKQ